MGVFPPKLPENSRTDEKQSRNYGSCSPEKTLLIVLSAGDERWLRRVILSAKHQVDARRKKPCRWRYKRLSCIKHLTDLKTQAISQHPGMPGCGGGRSCSHWSDSCIDCIAFLLCPRATWLNINSDRGHVAKRHSLYAGGDHQLHRRI